MENRVDNVVRYALSIANDDTHGYSQVNRWGPDYDCSSFVIECYNHEGIPVKVNGATYTGNMLSAFLKLERTSQSMDTFNTVFIPKCCY